MKNKLKSFAVNFRTLPALENAPTPEKQSEKIFVQNNIFANVILSAIAHLGDGNDDMGAEYNAAECASYLAIIGEAFLSEMRNQFYNLLEITEAKNEQSK